MGIDWYQKMNISLSLSFQQIIVILFIFFFTRFTLITQSRSAIDRRQPVLITFLTYEFHN